MNNDLGIAIRTVELGMAVLRPKVITIGCTLLTFALFAWAMAEPDLQRIATASIFALFSLAVMRKESKDGVSSPQ